MPEPTSFAAAPAQGQPSERLYGLYVQMLEKLPADEWLEILQLSQINGLAAASVVSLASLMACLSVAEDGLDDWRKELLWEINGWGPHQWLDVMHAVARGADSSSKAYTNIVLLHHASWAVLRANLFQANLSEATKDRSPQKPKD